MTLDTPEGLSIIWVPAIKKFALYHGVTRIVTLSDSDLREYGLHAAPPKARQQ